MPTQYAQLLAEAKRKNIIENARRAEQGLPFTRIVEHDEIPKAISRGLILAPMETFGTVANIDWLVEDAKAARNTLAYAPRIANLKEAYYTGSPWTYFISVVPEVTTTLAPYVIVVVYIWRKLFTRTFKKS